MKKFIINLIKIILGLIGFISFILFVFFITLIFKNLFFSNVQIIDNFFNYELFCGTDLVLMEINNQCKTLITVYWLILLSFLSFIFGLLSLYPFFTIKKNLN